MKPIISKYFLLIVLITLELSCKKNTATKSTKTEAPVGELVIYVKQVVNNKETPLNAALVKLYDNEVARASNTYIIQQKLTDSLGTVHFYELEKETYYIHMSHPTKGTLESTVSVPVRSIAYNTYVFQ